MPASRKHPILTILAGPNGSGKSTLASRLMLEGAFGVLVNADEIARSMDHRKGEAVPGKETQWEAAVSAEQMRWTLLSQRIDFMTETVMSDGDRWIRFLAAAKEAGYKIVMYFVTTADPAINVRRVSGVLSPNRRKFRHPTAWILGIDTSAYSASRSPASSMSNALGSNGPPSHSTSSRRWALRRLASTLSMSP